MTTFTGIVSAQKAEGEEVTIEVLAADNSSQSFLAYTDATGNYSSQATFAVGVYQAQASVEKIVAEGKVYKAAKSEVVSFEVLEAEIDRTVTLNVA